MGRPRECLGVTATLEQPVPMLGLHSQRLGMVRRCRMLLGSGTVAALELQTRWQRIDIECSAVSYDPEQQVFRLKRGDVLVRGI